MDCSTPGFPVLHHLPEFELTHVHWVGDVIQPFHRLLSPSPPAFNLSQHEGVFVCLFVFPQWVASSHQAAKVLELQLQHQSFQWIFRSDFLSDWLVWSACCPRNSVKEYSPAPQFKGINSSELSLFIVQLSHPYMTIGKTIALTIWTFVGKVTSLLCYIHCLGLS